MILIMKYKNIIKLTKKKKYKYLFKIYNNNNNIYAIYK